MEFWVFIKITVLYAKRIIMDFLAYFICFDFRGFPVWLKYVPGISFRTDNGPFKVREYEIF